jgi:DNA uptake protein ComE-like DNA-binding protein
MPTSNERKALWFLALVALSGSGVRLWRSARDPIAPTEAAALAQQIGRVDSARAAGRSPKRKKSDKPKAPTPAQPLDVDRASVAEIEALPGIGPALAARIVSTRDSLQGFGSIETLCVVRGVGPTLAQRLRPLVTFTGAFRPVSGACDVGSDGVLKPAGKKPSQPR